MDSGIYVWYLDGIPKYVGQSINVEHRMKQKHNECSVLARAINKYGFDAFDKRILRLCDTEDLDYWETYYIKKLNTHVTKGGYNVSHGGNHKSFSLRSGEIEVGGIRLSTATKMLWLMLACLVFGLSASMIGDMIIGGIGAIISGCIAIVLWFSIMVN